MAYQDPLCYGHHHAWQHVIYATAYAFLESAKVSAVLRRSPNTAGMVVEFENFRPA